MKGMRLNRQMFLVGVSLLLTIVMMAACMPVQPVAHVEAQAAPPEDMEAVVNGIWREYESSLLAGDLERWVAQWAEDGVQMPPGEPPRVGKETIQSKVGGFMDQFQYTEFAITNQEIVKADGWAFVRGVYKYTVAPKAGGDSAAGEGKYMTILQKQPDGAWKLYRDIFNSNTP